MIKKPRKPFSRRHGYSGQPREITIREDAPENLRHFVLDTAVELGLGPYALRDDACAMLHVRPDPGNWSAYPNVWDEVQGLIYDCEWFRVYDFIERVHQRLEKLREDNPSKSGLAVAGEREGHATALVDLDPQGSASAWANLRVADTPRCHLGVRGSTTRPPGAWGCSRWPAA